MSRNLKLSRSLRRLLNEGTDEQIAEIIRDASIQVNRDSKEFAPVVTGHLRRSIGFKTRGASGTVRASASYASYVEFGKSRHKVSFSGRFYLKRALDKLEGNLSDIVKRVFGKWR